MNLDWAASAALFLAGLPCGVFLLNLTAYRVVPRVSKAKNGGRPAVGPLSVLIPARNEAGKIEATLEAILRNTGLEFEVIVLDDHSTDETAAIVRRWVERDPRVRLHDAPELPEGWCGKQHACFVLARLARYPHFVFLDADVQLAPDALRRIGAFFQQSGAALVSGVPRQRVESFGERLLIPLIHFVLLGYLPLPIMRRTRWPALSGGCGQLFVASQEAYFATGGHARIRGSLHDGVQLPRAFRRERFVTDLFDATDVAECRMYQSSSETWRGLGKNAVEGLGSPGTIVPMTILLLGGQVGPFVLLFASRLLSNEGLVCAVLAAICALLPRVLATPRFRQPWTGALLHPIAILALVAIQWQSLFRHWRRRPSEWKGRSYAMSGGEPARKPA